jgi:hypothetical protein
MISPAFDAIVPMLSVTLAALACMAAEAFREPGERMPLGGLGIVGLLGAAISAAILWNGNTASFGVISGDNFGLFVTLVLVAVGILTIMFSSQVIHRDGIPAGEYYCSSSSSRSRCSRSPSTCSRASAARIRAPPRRPLSTSCSVRSRARFSCTASRSPSA